MECATGRDVIHLEVGEPDFPTPPHIVEKLRMLKAGTLKRPIDIFDLFWHAWPFALLAYKVAVDIMHRAG